MKQLLQRIKNQSGFIEIEYLMAAGIGLIVIAAFTTGIAQMSGLQRRNDIAQDSSLLIEDIAAAMKSGDYCTQKMQTVALPATGTESQISLPFDFGGVSTTLAEGQEVQPGYGLWITKLRLFRNGAVIPSNVVTSAGTFQQTSAILRVGTEKLVNGQPVAMRDRDIPLTLTVDPISQQVKYCNTDSFAAQACYQSGGKYSESATPPATKCMPVNHCDYGGTFSDDPQYGFNNPLTGTRGCKPGYTAERTGTVSLLVAAPKYTGVSNRYYGISTCMRCGTTLAAQPAGVSNSIIDSTSLAQAVDTVGGMNGYYIGVDGHIHSTGQIVGVVPMPTAVPTAMPTAAPTAVPTAMPGGATCDGSTYAVTPPGGGQPTGPGDCPSGSSFNPSTTSYVPGVGNVTVPAMCVCSNFAPAATPTATPTATPNTCQGWIDAYLAFHGSQCGGSLSCPTSNSVREVCDVGEWYTSSANGTPEYHSSGNNCMCFTAGTQVTMANGRTKAIETVQTGEQVLSFDEMKHEQIVTTVVEPIHHNARMQQMYEFELGDGRMIRSNDVHPMFVPEYGRYVETKEISSLFALGIKISFFDQSGQSIAIRKIRPYREKVRTYNLSVDGIIQGNRHHASGIGHNYYVEGVLAHNIKDHHELCP